VKDESRLVAHNHPDSLSRNLDQPAIIINIHSIKFIVRDQYSENIYSGANKINFEIINWLNNMVNAAYFFAGQFSYPLALSHHNTAQKTFLR
jgi:hypothetical protein